MKGRFLLYTSYWYCFVCHTRKQSSVSPVGQSQASHSLQYQELSNKCGELHCSKSIDLFQLVVVISSYKNDEEIVDKLVLHCNHILFVDNNYPSTLLLEYGYTNIEKRRLYIFITCVV